jgi:hypothetical protein
MKGIWNNIVNFIRRLMLQHQKISVDANKVVAYFCLLGFIHDSLPIFLANELNVALVQVSGEKMCR